MRGRRGEAGNGGGWHSIGLVRTGGAAFGNGKAGHGLVRQAWSGAVSHGQAWQAWRGGALYGMARQDLA